jgi:hypothetical protein
MGRKIDSPMGIVATVDLDPNYWRWIQSKEDASLDVVSRAGHEDADAGVFVF